MDSKRAVSKLIYVLPVLWAVLIRCAIGLYPHSGQGKAPLFGDFEAQRHWMEITVNLPLKEWYHNSTENDLNYWGLDYPPLTAYHSYVLGLIVMLRNNSWVSLPESRGIETLELRALMRNFVLFTDCIIFLPVLCFFFFVTCRRLLGTVAKLDVILCVLCYPGIILIDYGHFQYNSVSLGLFILSSVLLLHNFDIIASISFCMALSYKQMELYHALPIFFFLLYKGTRRSLRHLFAISITVIITFLIILSPFIIFDNPIKAISQILLRLFPLSRGIFEDKVSNLWCALSVFIKWQKVAPQTMFAVCAVTTLFAALPACFAILACPRKVYRYLYASLIVSLGFFLFSYQVHEKSILIPAMSAILLSPLEPFWSLSFLHFSTLSMWPLLVKDGLAFPTIILCLLFIMFSVNIVSAAHKLEKCAFVIFNLGHLVIIGLSCVVDPPSQYPFLYPLLISQWSCIIFLVHFFYFNWRIFIK